MTTLKLENADVDPTEVFTEKPEYVADVERFAVFTQLARLLAAEDIIVRWNVRGMDCPASMNYATRVLDVAPIRKDRENMIPGLILHEVGHFLFSENVAIKSTDGHSIDVERAKDLRDRIKNHRVWNIIEDGFVERRLVAKWPGALKHLRVLYDFDLEMSVTNNEMSNALRTHSVLAELSLVPDIINTLHLNVIGAKWNERFSYPTSTPQKLLGLLEKARLCMGTPTERADLSSEIVTELVALSRKSAPAIAIGARPTKTRPAVEPVEPASDEDEDDDGDFPTGVSEMKLPEMTPEEKDKMETEVKQLQQQDLVEKTLGADLDVDRNKSAKSAETPEPPTKKKTDADDIGGLGVGGGSSPEDSVEPAADEETDEEEDSEETTAEAANDETDDYSYLEQFISDSKARMIGANKNFLEHIMYNDVDVEEESVRHIPSMAQVMATCEQVELLSEAAQQATSNVSFRRFLASLTKSIYNETKRLPNQFNKKLTIARGNAQQMYQRFTTKANSMNVALTRYRTTGTLDPTRAALYQIYDDVFQKKRQAPNQINHSYVVMVDWSSSMNNSTMELFHRIAELSFFAQLANVEIDIWLYTTTSAMREEKLALAKDKLQPNVLLLGSKFIHVLNTKQHVGDQLSYRLYAMFINAAKIRNHRMYSSVLVHGSAPLLGLNFADEVLHSQNGTNIFEALNFAVARAQKLTSHRKAILLMTDGDDNSFGIVADGEGGQMKGVRIPSDLTYDKVKGIRQVMYNGANLIDIAEAANRSAADTGYRSCPLVNVRTLASLMLADEAREQGIAIIGVTWGSYISAHMEAWSRKNVVRIEVPYKDLFSKSLNVYSPVENTFITHITEALLSNIKK